VPPFFLNTKKMLSGFHYNLFIDYNEKDFRSIPHAADALICSHNFYAAKASFLIPNYPFAKANGK